MDPTLRMRMTLRWILFAFLGLNVDGLIYAAKSPDSDSHHFYTNEFDTGNYIKILTINEEGLIVYKDDGTSDAVTKDKIGNWNYAYNNTIESPWFLTHRLLSLQPHR